VQIVQIKWANMRRKDSIEIRNNMQCCELLVGLQSFKALGGLFNLFDGKTSPYGE